MSEETIKRIEGVLQAALGAFKAADDTDKLNAITSVLIDTLKVQQQLTSRAAFEACITRFKALNSDGWYERY